MTAKQWPVRALLLVLVAILASSCGSTITPTPETQTAAAAPTPQQATATAEPTPQQPVATFTPSATSKVEVALKSIKRLEGVTLATVNGQEVTWEDYELILRQTLYAIDRQNAVDWSDPAMQQRLGDLQNQVLQLTVDRLLLRQMAAQQGLVLDEAAVKAEVEREKTQILGSGVYADWNGFLQSFGLTDETFAQTIRDTLLLAALTAAQHVDTQSEQAHIAHIVVKDEATAEEVAARLKAGEAFAKLAAEYSEDTETKETGGDLGWFSKETMLPELAGPAFSLEPGQFSEPIFTQYGYTIIQVLERAIREDEQQVIRKRQQQALSALLEAEKAKAQIEYLVDFTADQRNPD
jgi:parvulin-like peptidyl-prolyl isomerase